VKTVTVGNTIYEDSGNGSLIAIGEADLDGQGTSTVLAADVRPEIVEWLWPNMVPRAMPSVLGGFPGVGKSTILYDLAARVSREGQAVLVVTAEDHLAAVVRPRLEAAGADLNLVRIVTIPITLPDDVGRLKELVREFEAALLILDPLVAFIGDGINTHRDHHVRRVLAPLADLAEETRAAVVVVIHTNKGVGSEPLMRISGSIGFTGAARSVLLAADDPQDESRRILAVVKSNLAEMPPPLAYRLAGVDLEGGISTSRVEWLGEAPEVDIRELLVSRDPEERGATEDAQDFLRELGLLETARPAGDVLRDAKTQGHTERTIQRARKALRIPTWRDGFGRAGVWYWGPRDGVPIDATHRRQPTLGALAPMNLPAETESSDSIGANMPTLGAASRTAFEVLSSSDSEEWYTPPHIVEAVLAVLGEVDLDPCANPGKPAIPATVHYRKADDGLAHAWQGRVYMNPPYGRAILPWVRKLDAEHRWGHVSEAIALVPSRPDTEWFALLDAFPRCEIRGRLTFANAANPAPFPSALFYLGKNHQRFIEVFSSLGRIVQPVESPPRLVPSLDGQGSDGCPDCGWKWFHGHAEDCPRRRKDG
jgi:hypothetical protein